MSYDFLRAQNTHVVCVGDIMLDHYIFGSTDRISPEAPVPVLNITHEKNTLGGAGNVARGISALGPQVTLVGVLGDDATGRTLTALAAQEPRLELAAPIDLQRTSTVKSRFISAGQQILRADHETPHELSAELSHTVTTTVERALGNAAVLCLSDYDKGVLTPAVCRATIAAARQLGIPVVVDPKGRDYTRYRGAFLLTPNRRELAEASAAPVKSLAQVELAARQLCDTLELGGMIVTLSAEGLLWVQTGGEAQHFPSLAREVFDVTGAGDTVVATLATLLAQGASLAEAVNIANLAAGLAVAKRGTAVILPPELSAALDADATQPTGYPGAKIFTRQLALAQVQKWRGQKLRVGFTNGCFDLLHPGHVHLLSTARAHCDKLIVAINTDASVRALKGPARPIQDEASRAQVLAALTAVDAVTFFDEATPYALVAELEPDVIIKGGDYTPATVVGADLVAGRGGRVVIIPTVPGHSTTALAQRSQTPNR